LLGGIYAIPFRSLSKRKEMQKYFFNQKPGWKLSASFTPCKMCLVSHQGGKTFFSDISFHIFLFAGSLAMFMMAELSRGFILLSK
jgi:hypothetical protein